MNSRAIDNILKRNQATRNLYLGCFPSDKIPMSAIFPHCMVVNTDTSANVGEHWTAIFVESGTHVEYYDSLAIWPPIDNIARFLNKFAHILYNDVPLQSDFSSSCGKHVIYFLIKRCKTAESFKEIVEKLSLNKTSADRIVNTYVRRLMGEPI